MRHELRGDLETLQGLYNQQVDILQERLLNGELWEDLQAQRRDVTELAIAIQKLHNHSVSKNTRDGNPAEFPHTDHFSAEPVE
jgi:hypothetical protein